jgi:indolepyruvate ferredoxin oxidoreductase beta subunit
MADRKRITIAALALGGQGGGVLADWILAVGDAGGYRTQGTSIAGVAQRTGSTVYYIEMFPVEAGPEPMLSLNPVPGDIDIVIASELMECGRAILRGFVSKERTTVISSTNRIYAISEKSGMGDARASSQRILDAAQERARRFVGFDMEAATARSGSVISSVMLGALAGSSALPFPRSAFEAAIRASGIAVDANLRGFAIGYAEAQHDVALPQAISHSLPEPTTTAGRGLQQRILAELPPAARANALHAVQRLMDYQDRAYAELYLDRLAKVRAVDDGRDNHALTTETARYLALWMSYEDSIRVADLKTRSSRIARVEEEVRLAPDQLMGVTEFLHPRLEEICDILPAGLGRGIRASRWARRWSAPLFAKGRYVATTSLRWFLILRMLAGLRRWRRGSLRYAEEQARIAAWLELVVEAAASDQAAAYELVACQRLIKGYSDTFERGLRNYAAVSDLYRRLRGEPGVAEALRRAREAALADENGAELERLLGQLAA